MTPLKLDENLGANLLSRAREAGYDAESVRSENLNGAEDSVLFARCVEEQRTLITLDLDFSNPLRFPPPGTSGTIVLRPHRPSHIEIEKLFETALEKLGGERVRARIWIVEPGRLRIYRDWDADEEEYV
jgi:predicted nuclease of predicted toxin-antitoxin system